MKQIVVALLLLIPSDAARAEFSVVEASIADMQRRWRAGASPRASSFSST